MKYAMFICIDPEVTDEDAAAAPSVDDWFDRMREEGAYHLGVRLQPADQARTVRVRGGKVTTTEGPFTESAEWIAGVAIIDADTPEQALEHALAHNMAYEGRIELRPIHSYGGPLWDDGKAPF
jgi:hypothetical protein